jgi:hypothetical protein
MQTDFFIPELKISLMKQQLLLKLNDPTPADTHRASVSEIYTANFHSSVESRYYFIAACII